MCNPKYKIVLKTKKYEGLVWLMQALAFCSILDSTQKRLPYGGRSPEFHRDFQMNLLKAAFALVWIIFFYFLKLKKNFFEFI
jgi:hypothetical protein